MRVKIALNIDFNERTLEELSAPEDSDLRQSYKLVIKSKPEIGVLFSTFFEVPFRFNEGDIVDNIIPMAFKHNNDINYYALEQVLKHEDRATINGIEFNTDIHGIYQVIWVDI